MNAIFANSGTGTIALLSMSVILFSGFLLTRLTKILSLPNVSGFILAGILIGPCCLNLIGEDMVARMSFISDFALSMIAFNVGKFFRKEELRGMGLSGLWITLWEALLAGVLVTLSMRFLFAIDWPMSLLLGAIATATAPASTMMTIRQYHARGSFVSTLLQIIALDDVVCLMAFSITTAFLSSTGGNAVECALLPAGLNVLALLVGFGCGPLLSKLLSPKRSSDNRLILTIAFLLGISGGCAALNLSPLLPCMAFGASYVHFAHDTELFQQLDSFSPPVMSLFFIVAGMNLDVGALKSFGLLGVVYFLVRLIGKYAGTWLGCLLTHEPRKTRDYLGFALAPQAGVAIGLALLGNRILPEAEADLLMTLILSSSVLYELIGPVLAKFGLRRAGVLNPPQEEVKEAA